MKGWKPIAIAPRELGRPLLLYPRPQLWGNQEPRAADWIRNVSKDDEEEEDYDLEGDDDDDEEEEEDEGDHSAPPTIYASAFEGYWDGSRWRTSTGILCEPTHWMPMPTPPLTLI
jgi:hypothetical protein